MRPSLWGGLMTVPSQPTEGLQGARANRPARPGEPLNAITVLAAGRAAVTQVGRVVRPAHNKVRRAQTSPKENAAWVDKSQTASGVGTLLILFRLRLIPRLPGNFPRGSLRASPV